MEKPRWRTACLILMTVVIASCNGSGSDSDSSSRARGIQEMNTARSKGASGGVERGRTPDSSAAERIAVEQLRALRLMPERYKILSKKQFNVWRVTVTGEGAEAARRSTVTVDQFGRVIHVRPGK
ncbi:MAG: hypothetical protein DCC66_11310 [Planctomycetota bacterium]|nr:MAG: hypothetical protein DCC66_11310 [Planctomycetota bacterium]